MCRTLKSSKAELPLLTSREKEILGLIAEGYTNSQIAEKIFLSPFTVDSHRKNLLAKLAVKKYCQPDQAGSRKKIDLILLNK